MSANGKRKTEAAATRSEPTSAGEKTLRPCLIRMNDVPQINERTMSKNTAVPFLFSGII